jgi:3-oxoacyl-ACP reductase-like protein
VQRYSLTALPSHVAMAVSADDLAVCMSVLRRLGPHIEHTEHAELNELGKSVWRRIVIKERFGEQDVVTFLSESQKHKQMLKRLERLQVAVLLAHDERVQEAARCEINVQRSEESISIEAASAALRDSQGLLPLTSHQQHELEQRKSVSESKRKLENRKLEQRKEAQVGSQHVALRDPAAGPDSAPMSWVTCREYKRAEFGRETPPGQEPEPSQAVDGSTDQPQIDLAKLAKAVSIPVGSLRRYCACCKAPYHQLHSFYHQLCSRCAALNYSKRNQSADMAGMVAIVTGGRVRIGYQIALKLLRAGATVLVTSRYPNDALVRYARELDYTAWAKKLQVCMCPLELADIAGVEAFTAAMRQRFRRIHVLINNAAQTLTRPVRWPHRIDL